MLFVVRHGERADYAGDDEKKQIQISFDPHLTQLGKLQARRAGDALMRLVKEDYKGTGVKPEDRRYLIISSPFRRCIQTAYHVSQALPQDKIIDGKIFLDDFLCEHLDDLHYVKDILEDLQVRVNFEEVKKHIGLEIQDGFPTVGTHSIKPEYPEGLKIHQRVKDGFEKIRPHLMQVVNKDDDVVVIFVSHGYVVECFLDMYECIDAKKPVDYTCLSQYRMTHDGIGKQVITQIYEQLPLADEDYKNGIRL